MKIIYLHQYFKTKEEGGSHRSLFIAKAMVEAGFEVEMITAHNKKTPTYKMIDGIKVHYLPVYYDNKLGTVQRIISFIKFTWQCYRKARQIKQQAIDTPCICYATSTPLTIGWVALWLKRWQNIPYVFEVRDLWPQAPIEMGVINNGWLQQRLFALEAKIYRKALQIVTLSPGMQAAVQQKVPEKGILLAPNMADCHFFSPTLSTTKPPFVISYIGTIGKANHLDYLLQIASLAEKKGVDQVEFWIIGEGKALANVRQKAKKLTNVKLYGAVDKSTTRRLLDQSHATYTSFLAKPVLTTCSPNKFFDSLAAGKLTIVNTSGWLKEIVEENQCGFYAAPDKPGDFLDQLMPFITQVDLLQKYQQNARKVAERQFSREKITQQVVNLVKTQFDKQRKRKMV
ncbi:glycosyltransferase family 4 protein [uncultured Microscilla sp.]|uniref:glycosyltransferase family 4 protein n=1 Tax=uncultured Microscilla sp. TaxID=432653 RepID=UPI00261CFFE5|nr:glycosyltransferase family 4 protein [uncultured Microscilla sp.]